MLDDLVVVDTDVFSRLLITPREQDHEATVWRLLLLGKQIVIAAQTEGEIRFGAQVRNWGPARMHALNRHFMATATLPVSSEVISAFASLRATCVQAATHSATRCTWAMPGSPRAHMPMA
ncbi:MAG: hypothetical protein Q4G46_15895 [Propionibacteriaceae bacterium]|nr:hypothetical protein [Propionibacteriaceae bacterium]